MAAREYGGQRLDGYSLRFNDLVFSDIIIIR